MRLKKEKRAQVSVENQKKKKKQKEFFSCRIEYNNYNKKHSMNIENY